MSTSDTKPVIDLVKELHKPEVIELPTESVVGVIARPNGVTLESLKRYLDEYAERPDRLKGESELYSLESFIDHVNRTKSPNSVVFANSNRQTPRLLAVYNYDHQNDAPEELASCPEFRDHRAGYMFPLSDEWKAWTENDGNDLEQSQFARFIEDRIVDVIEPEAATAEVAALLGKIDCSLCGAARLAELSRGLELRVGHEYSQAVRIQNGEASIVWKEKHTDSKGEPLKVPGAFMIAIPLWRSGDLWKIPVRLRYRPMGGRVVWSYQLFRTERIFDVAIQNACERVRKETALQVFEGVPEK